MVLKRRHIAKAITWRIFSTMVTISIVIAITRDVGIGLAIGPIDLVVKLVLYYLHERCWIRVKFGLRDNLT